MGRIYGKVKFCVLSGRDELVIHNKSGDDDETQELTMPLCGFGYDGFICVDK